eukprot:g18697.t1
MCRLRWVGRGKLSHSVSPAAYALLPLSSPSVAITSGGTIQLGSTGSDGIQGLQALTVTSAATARPGAILQLTPTADGQHLLVPSNQVVVQTSSGDVQTYQIRPSPGTNSVPQTNRAGEATLKREIRLMKN